MSAVVVDASVWCDALLPGPRRDAARSALEPYDVLVAPEHLRLEVTQVLRKHARSELGAAQVAKIVDVLRELPLTVIPTVELLDRVWELRDCLTAYDAAYLAAAEHYNAFLLTRDKGLLGCNGYARCPIVSP